MLKKGDLTFINEVFSAIDSFQQDRYEKFLNKCKEEKMV